jgi:DNA-binding transcriptional LysR family regulator
MNPRHLEFVVGVAEHGSFTRAAEALHVSQPALSRAITALEEQIGAALFHRVGRSVSLTSAGEVFVESARPVLRELSVLNASLNAVAELKAGLLDVAAPHASPDLLAPLVGQLRSRHPGVRVRIQTSENPHDIERYVRTGRCELALTVEDVEPPLVAEVVGKEEIFAVFPPGTKLKRRPVKRDDLAGQRLVVPVGSYEYYGRILDGAPARGTSTPLDTAFVAVETESRQALVPLVLAGAGFAFLPHALAEGAACQGLVIAPLDPPRERTIRLVTRPGPLSPAASVFAELARGNSQRA